MNENLMTIKDICRELGIGKTTAYKLIKDKKIHSGRLGKKIIVRKSDINKYINKIMQGK